MIEQFDLDDPRWDEAVSGFPREPYCDRRYLAAVAAADGTRPVLLLARSSGWSAVYVVVLCRLGDGKLMARTPEYGGPLIRSEGAPIRRAAADLRMLLDRHVAELGAIEEVILLSPWLVGHRQIALCWSCQPEKDICIVRMPELPKLWHSMQKRKRTYVNRARRDLRVSVGDLTPEAAVRFSARYSAAMDRLEAKPRWRFGREYFEGLSERAGELFMLVEVEGGDGGATALFLVVDDRAVYYLAARWGSERGASPFALWHGLEQLREAGVEEMLLGGGVSSRPDDPLLNFKTSFASYSVPLQLGGRIYDRSALHEALDRGQVRQPPRSSVAL